MSEQVTSAAQKHSKLKSRSSRFWSVKDVRFITLILFKIAIQKFNLQIQRDQLRVALSGFQVCCTYSLDRMAYTPLKMRT